MSVFKDFPGLENLEKKFKDFQGPTRALIYSRAAKRSTFLITITHAINNFNHSAVELLAEDQDLQCCTFF